MSALFPDRIRTERLELTPLTLDDVDPLAYYDHCRVGAPAIDEVTEHLPWEPHRTPKETREFLARVSERRREDEAAEWVVRPADGEDGAGEVAGATGIHVDWEHERAELGIWLRKRFWGRGYSGERAAALLELAFDRLDLGVVRVAHVVGNENSRRAIERYVGDHGGVRHGVERNGVVVDGEPRNVVRYSVAADEWAEAVGD